jgi:hypothetical protein
VDHTTWGEMKMMMIFGKNKNVSETYIIKKLMIFLGKKYGYSTKDLKMLAAPNYTHLIFSR